MVFQYKNWEGKVNFYFYLLREGNWSCESGSEGVRLLSKFDIESSKGQSRKISYYKMRNANFYFYLLREGNWSCESGSEGVRLLGKFDIESSNGQSRKISYYKMKNDMSTTL